MKKDINIDVHHLTRVEGHGNIVVNVKNGTIEKCEWQVPEAPRFFEAMVRGRHYTEVQRITSRICGICSIGHTLAAVKAVEDACGIQITKQTEKLRRIIKHAENFDSHVLHIGVLVAPDLLGAPSVFPLVETHGEVVKIVLRLKRLGHEWGSLLAGRSTHPTTCVPGGFSKLPTKEDLISLKEKILAHVNDINALVEVVSSLASKIPAFDRPTEYMAVSNDIEYGMYAGNTVQTIMPDGTKQMYDVHDYKSITNEFMDPKSTSKWCKNKMDSYAAGALARFNNNYDQLYPQAKKIAEALGMKPVTCNPFLNSAAQLVECAHSVYETLDLIDELIAEGIKEESVVKPTKFGQGTSAVDVPRGILFHDYTFDNDGFCISGNCIIPTGQNHANIQKDFEALVPVLLEQNKTEEEMELALSMLVRAYDPCISCSTHYLKVKFVR
ncbi:MAG: nickel-dependent hydrogenase large subunit [Bacteriovoracaceae bacterium]|nr:nickel-dependent hydrogenase large subunit [Bacteriovoracaceae bacterium]